MLSDPVLSAELFFLCPDFFHRLKNGLSPAVPPSAQKMLEAHPPPTAPRGRATSFLPGSRKPRVFFLNSVRVLASFCRRRSLPESVLGTLPPGRIAGFFSFLGTTLILATSFLLPFALWLASSPFPPDCFFLCTGFLRHTTDS